PLQLCPRVRPVTIQQLAGCPATYFWWTSGDTLIPQQHEGALESHLTEIRTTGHALVLHTLLQQQVIEPVALHQLPRLGAYGQRLPRHVLITVAQLGDKQVLQQTLLTINLLGIGAALQGRVSLAEKTTRRQQLQHRAILLLIKQPHHLGFRARRDVQAEQRHQRRGHQHRPQQAACVTAQTETSSPHHHELVVDAEPAEHQQHADKHAQRQQHLEEFRQAEKNQQQQDIGRDFSRRRLGQVLDKAAADQHHHQHETDHHRGHEQLPIDVTIKNQVGPAPVWCAGIVT